MNDAASRTGIGFAVSAAVLSVVFALFVPYGYPWPALAWAVVAGAVGVWVAMRSIRPTVSIFEVIGDVEAEPPRTKAAPAREVVSTRAVS
jgi:hypothetical protein